MTVRELIVQLLDMPGGADVWVSAGDMSALPAEVKRAGEAVVIR